MWPSLPQSPFGLSPVNTVAYGEQWPPTEVITQPLSLFISPPSHLRRSLYHINIVPELSTASPGVVQLQTITTWTAPTILTPFHHTTLNTGVYGNTENIVRWWHSHYQRTGKGVTGVGLTSISIPGCWGMRGRSPFKSSVQLLNALGSWWNCLTAWCFGQSNYYNDDNIIPLKVSNSSVVIDSFGWNVALPAVHLWVQFP
jgi:hypothetical protein